MSDHGCKVCRVLGERGLAHLDDELAARWHGEAGERMGYRRLADWLNATLLRHEMERVGLPSGGGEAQSRYERLTGEADTAEAVGDLLRREGVGVDALLDDFVSYSVVRTHLRDCLGEEREPSPPTEWEADRLNELEAYATAEAADAVRSLVNKGKLSAGGDVAPAVTIRVACSNCGVAVPVTEALAAGAFCDCSAGRDDTPTE